MLSTLSSLIVGAAAVSATVTYPNEYKLMPGHVNKEHVVSPLPSVRSLRSLRLLPLSVSCVRGPCPLSVSSSAPLLRAISLSRRRLVLSLCRVSSTLVYFRFRSAFRFSSPNAQTYIKASDVPQNFYWGNNNGVSYLTKNLNQHIPQV